jgi:hypothetical protein
MSQAACTMLSDSREQCQIQHDNKSLYNHTIMPSRSACRFVVLHDRGVQHVSNATAFGTAATDMDPEAYISQAMM